MGRKTMGRYLAGGNNPRGYNQHTGKKPIPDYGESLDGEVERLFRCIKCKHEMRSKKVFPWVIDKGTHLANTGREYNPTCKCGGEFEVIREDGEKL